MERIRGYKDATDTLEATTNRVAEEIVNAEDTDREFLMAQLDKFFAITYLLRFNLEKMMDEAECECEGQMGLDSIFRDMFEFREDNNRRDV